MITHIFGNPQDSNYQTKYDDYISQIRYLASTDISSPLTSQELPNALIESIPYLPAAEVQLLQDLNLTSSAVNSIMSGSDNEKIVNLQYMLMLATCLNMLPQLIQISSEKTGEVDIDYVKVAFAEKEEYWKNSYTSSIVIINPSTPTTQSGTININIAQTRSRVND